MKPEIGTPSGSSHAGSMLGHCDAATVKREFGWAALVPLCGVQSLPSQSMACAGGAPSMPSHHTSPSSVRATLVKMVFLDSIFIALGFERDDVPGATPKKPNSGLIARRRPSGPFLIQAMSSPMVVTFQPSKPA